MNIDDIKELFTAGGGALVVLLTLVQISPIKLNPWSKLAQLIGHALNAEVLEQQKQTQQKRGNSFYQVTHCLLLLPLRPAF